MLRELLRGLSHAGRIGGGIALIGGLLGLAAAIWMVAPSGRSGPMRPDLRGPGMLLVGSVTAIAFGVKVLFTGGAAAMRPLSLDTLRTQLMTRPRPYTVCMHCQRFEGPAASDCERCGIPLRRVDSPGDAESARASISW